MKKQILFAACTLFAASALLMTSCQQAEEPIANDPTDQAGPMTRAATLGNFYRVVYVEVNDVNPLNAGEYLLSDGTPFFTHVILFASNIRGDASGNVHNYNNPNKRRNSRKSVNLHCSASSQGHQGDYGQPRRPHRSRLCKSYRSTNRHLHG